MVFEFPDFFRTRADLHKNGTMSILATYLIRPNAWRNKSSSFGKRTSDAYE